MVNWISAGALIIAAGTIVWRDGISRGRTDELFERLTKLGEDHEGRIRELEHIRPPWESAGHRRRPPWSSG